jgi:hypothetical protein
LLALSLVFLVIFYAGAIVARLVIRADCRQSMMGVIVGLVVAAVYCLTITSSLVGNGLWETLLLPISAEQVVAGLPDQNASLLFPGLGGPPCPYPGGDPYLATFTTIAVFLLYMANAALQAIAVFTMPVGVTIMVLGAIRGLRGWWVTWIRFGARWLWPLGLICMGCGAILLRILYGTGVCG